MSTHFSKRAVKFLRDLKLTNDRSWFAEHKAIYENELRAPMLALINEINEAMLSFAPEHIRPPEKSMLRIYRDIRFSSDKRPYKTHVSGWWARTGLRKTSGAGFYLHVSGTELRIAAGVFMPERDQLLAIRRSLVHSHREVNDLIAPERLRGLMGPSLGTRLTRPPKGFASESGAALDLIRCREWGLAATLPISRATSPDLLEDVLIRFRLAAPLVALLNEPLKGGNKKSIF